MTELEELTDKTEAHCHVQRLSTRLATLDSEQSTLDKHDGDVDILSIHIQRLLAATNPNSTSSSNEHKSLSRNLALLDESLETIDVAVNSLSPETEDLALIQQYQEELLDIKGPLATYRDCLSHLELPEDDELRVRYSQLKTLHFNCCNKIKKIINYQGSSSSTLSTSMDAKGLKTGSPNI